MLLLWCWRYSESLNSSSYKSKAPDKSKNQFFSSVVRRMYFAFAYLLSVLPSLSHIINRVKNSWFIPACLWKLYGRNNYSLKISFIPLRFLYVCIISFTRLILAIDAMRSLMGRLVHRAEIDSERQMSCQSKTH